MGIAWELQALYQRMEQLLLRSTVDQKVTDIVGIIAQAWRDLGAHQQAVPAVVPVRAADR